MSIDRTPPPSDGEGPPRPVRTPATQPSRPEPLWRHAVGEHLRNARHTQGDTLGDTARRAGISPQYLSEIERGLKEPSSEMIAAVAGALDLTLADLTRDVAESLGAYRPRASAQRFRLAA